MFRMDSTGPSVKRRWLPSLAAGLLTAAGFTVPVAAQQADWPSRPVRMIVPYAPGGGADIVGRILGQCLSQGLGQPIIVENRAGAGGTIGTDAAAKSPPDGYTIVLHTLSSIVLNNYLYAKLPYDPLKDFVPISEVGRAPNVLAARKDLPARSVEEFVALARKEAGGLSYGSGGNGSVPHLAAVLLTQRAKVEAVHVPFRGGGPALTALMAQQVDFVIDAVPVMLPQLRDGTIRALAVTSPERISLLPDLPTVSEAGVPGYATQNWYGLFAPARTPATVIERLAAETARVAADPDCRRRLIDLGVEPVGSNPEAFATQWRSEMQTWEPVVRASGARLD
jgi:tripartite-type tricarboxylate transporter receptor subunit TctC